MQSVTINRASVEVFESGIEGIDEEGQETFGVFWFVKAITVDGSKAVHKHQFPSRTAAESVAEKIKAAGSIRPQFWNENRWR